MMHKRRRLLTTIALITVLMFTSCLFDSRDAQPPTQGTGGGCVLDTSERPFTCITKALASGSDADYERSISQNFVFIPTPTDATDEAFVGKPVYENWTKDVEMQVLRKLLDDTSYTQVDFGSLTPLQNENTFVQYSVSYALRTVDNTTPTDTLTWKAVAQIDVRLENGNWRLTKWDEQQTVEGFRTWGYLRGIKRLSLLP